MLQRERLLRHERGATHASLRVDDGQFALGLESANLSKNRRPPARAGRRSALHLLANAEILRFALLKITPCQSFPRKRESSRMWTELDPRLRGGDNTGDFHLLGWAAGPSILSRNSTHYSFPLSSLGRACLSRPRPATNPSPGPRRLVKAPSRSTLSPWERADPLCHALRF